MQYGTGEYRVMRWRLSPDGRKVTASEILEYRTDLVSDPTTGVILSDGFYFIGNTGIYNLRDDNIVDRAKLEPVHIAAVSLKKYQFSHIMSAPAHSFPKAATTARVGKN